MSIDRPLIQIETEDIAELLRVPHREDRTTEYKRELADADDRILKAVAAFANTLGGDLIFGIDAPEGLPTSAPGLDPSGVDKGISRIMQLARSGLQPPLPLRDLDFKEVTWQQGRVVLVLRVPRSWAGPHQMKTRHIIYGRNSTESYPLDVTELRQAFLMSETLPERVRTFVRDQVVKVRLGELPVLIPRKPKLLFHLIPISAFSLGNRIMSDETLSNFRISCQSSFTAKA
jgi:hypothetical protein